MRILRRRSNHEVSAQGFALFVAGLVVASFVGGALRTTLSSERVHQRILRELKRNFPKNDVDVQSIDVMLSRGVWPALGVRVHDLTLRQDPCGKLAFDLRVPEAVLPVSLWTLRHGRIRLGKVDIPGGRLDLDYHACPRAGENEVARVPTLREVVRERGIQPPRLDAPRIAEALEGVNLSLIDVTFKKAPQWKLRLLDARVRFGERLSVRASLDLQRALPFGAVSHLIAVEAESAGSVIEGELNSDLKEGRIKLGGRWNLDDNTARLTAQVTQLPLKELTSELAQTGWLKEEPKFKSAWLTGAATWEGPLNEPGLRPVVLTAARIEGLYGRVSLDHAEMYPERQPPFPDAVDVRGTRLQVAALADAFGLKLAPVIVARPGTWTGTLHARGPREWRAAGRLENVEITFSNQSARGKQIIDGVDVEIKRAGDALDALLDHFAFNQGTAQGAVGGSYEIPLHNGRFEAKFESLSFSPAVQTVLTGGQIAPLRLLSSGAILKNRLAAWTTSVSAPTVTGDGWVAEDASVQTALNPDLSIQATARVGRVSVDPRWRHFQSVSSTLPRDADRYRWRDLTAKFNVRADGGTLQSLRALGNDGPWNLAGAWARDGEANASLKIGAGPKPKAYRLKGEKGVVAVEPD